MRIERLDWLAKQPGYTARLARQIGRRYRESTLTSIAKEFRLDWHTVHELDKEYMAEQSAVIGIASWSAISNFVDRSGLAEPTVPQPVSIRSISGWS